MGLSAIKIRDCLKTTLGRIVENERMVGPGDRERQVRHAALICAPNVFFRHIVPTKQHTVVYPRDIDGGVTGANVDQDHVKAKLPGFKHHLQVIVPRKSRFNGKASPSFQVVRCLPQGLPSCCKRR